MARVVTIGKARASKTERRCHACRHIIQPGETYRKVSKKTGPRSGYTLYWCREHKPKASDLASGRTQELMQLTEGLEEDLAQAEGDPEAVKSALESAESIIETFVEEIRGGAESMEEGFGHSTTQTENMAETADNLEVWGQGLTSLASEINVESPDEERDYTAEAYEQLSEAPELNLTG